MHFKNGPVHFSFNPSPTALMHQTYMLSFAIGNAIALLSLACPVLAAQHSFLLASIVFLSFPLLSQSCLPHNDLVHQLLRKGATILTYCTN